MSTTGNTRQELNRLLEQRRGQPQRAAEIDRRISETFGRTCAVLVLDLSGFTRLTQHHGICHFLSIIRHMHERAEPIVQAHGGRVIKQEADNLFAVFADAPEATRAGAAMLKAFAVASGELHVDEAVQAGMGVGYGEILVVGEEDLYGNEVNLASKLGEDLAQPGEILATESAYRRLQGGEREWQPLALSASGVPITAYRLQGEG